MDFQAAAQGGVTSTEPGSLPELRRWSLGLGKWRRLEFARFSSEKRLAQKELWRSAKGLSGVSAGLHTFVSKLPQAREEPLKWSRGKCLELTQGFPGGTCGKERTCQCKRCKRRGFNPFVGKIPVEGGHGNPLHYSCLENSMDRGAWWATAQRVAKSWTRLKWFSMHTHRPGIVFAPTLIAKPYNSEDVRCSEYWLIKWSRIKLTANLYSCSCIA